MRLPKNTGIGFQGSLSMTQVADILQLLHAGCRTGELGLSKGLGGKKARFYFSNGELCHAEAGDLTGLEALVEALDWKMGEFKFVVDAPQPNSNSFEMPIQFALMEAARIRDEINRKRVNPPLNRHRRSYAPPPSFRKPAPQGNRSAKTTKPKKAAPLSKPKPEADIEENRLPDMPIEDERRKEMNQNFRTSTEVLEELLKIPGIDAVVIAGRDGFVIESAGSTARLNLDSLGAALAHAVNSIEEMGAELNIDTFGDLFIEYGRAVILCRPTGEAVAALVSPDASKLGIVRHKSKNLFEALGRFF